MPESASAVVDPKAWLGPSKDGVNVSSSHKDGPGPG